MSRHDNCVHLLVSWVTITQIQVTVLVFTLFHSQKGQPSWVHIVATLFDDDYNEIVFFRQFKKSPFSRSFDLIKLWKYVA